MDGNRWTELFRSLPPAGRLAVVGALTVVVSLLFPWYGVQFGPGPSQTGLDSFGVGQLALLMTVGAAMYLVFRCAAGGYRLPQPLRVGTVLAMAGAWSAVLVGYLMVDRPEQILGRTEIHLRYGIFIALGGSIALLVGGLRLRRDEAAARDADNQAG